MIIKFSPSEKKLIEHAKKAVVRYNKMRHQKGCIDTLYAFIMSDSGKIHDGACLETNLAHAVVCGERHATANMVMAESYAAKIKHIIIAAPVPSVQKSGTQPCGTCRHIIWQFGTAETSVILMQYIQQKNGWIFPKLEKYLIKDLYPYPYEPDEDLWKKTVME